MKSVKILLSLLFTVLSLAFQANNLQAQNFYEDGKPHLEMTFSTNGKKVVLPTTSKMYDDSTDGYKPTLKITGSNYDFKLVINSNSVKVTGDTYRNVNVKVTPQVGTFDGKLIYYGQGVANEMSFDPPTGWDCTIEIAKYENGNIWFKFSSKNYRGTFEGIGENLKCAFE